VIDLVIQKIDLNLKGVVSSLASSSIYESPTKLGNSNDADNSVLPRKIWLSLLFYTTLGFD
jgi:hypothetical protein